MNVTNLLTPESGSLSDWTGVIVAVVALLVSLLSIYLTWASLHVQRRHNRLSVKPIPFCKPRDHLEEINVIISNNGTGPLLIKSVSIDDGITSKRDLISWIPRSPAGINRPKFVSIYSRWSIPANGSIILFELRGNSSNADFVQYRENVRQVLSKLFVSIEYTDIYNSKFDTFRDDLSFFARVRS